MSSRKLRIGTRESALAMYQTKLVGSLLASNAHEIVGITTAGDNQGITLTGQGSSGLFVNALRAALDDERVDLIVHSLKDLPTQADARFSLGAVPQRVDVHDVFVGRDGMSIDDLPEGGLVGTSSPRRAAWIRRRRPDLRTEPIRGNVDTRLAKVARGDYDATLLAHAGLSRLGLLTDSMVPIPVSELIPAPAQGALGVECRASDGELLEVLATLDNPVHRMTTTAERAVLREIGATCATAAGALATVDQGMLSIRADVCAVDSLERLYIEYSRRAATEAEADEIGAYVARELLDQGAAALVEFR